MSKPATLAPPSRVAASTRPISPVQVSIGEPLNGAVRRLSSSIATTTAGEAAGSCLRPNTSQRSAVRISRESPRIGLATGETEAAAQTSAMAATTILLRVLRLILKRPMARHAYSIRSSRPTIGVAPGLACGSTRNTICDDLNVAA